LFEAEPTATVDGVEVRLGPSVQCRAKVNEKNVLVSKNVTNKVNRVRVITN
jgi:hypothetical protein